MERKSSFALQSLLVILALNAVLIATIYFAAGDALAGKDLIVLGAGVVVTGVMWVAIQRLGKRLTAGAPPELPKPEPKPAPKALPEQPSEASALQLLSILQREGRLIDFLQEDLSRYDDAQIGAAVRSIHEGCKRALETYVTLEPIYDVPEGSTVTVEPGFDARAVRLSGNIAGDPPFKGALRHRGWRVVKIDLPKLMQAQDRVVAPAEVEVNG
ncbi:DUF2760 domain-containing protein [Rhodocaloribacter sp.]